MCGLVRFDVFIDTLLGQRTDRASDSPTDQHGEDGPDNDDARVIAGHRAYRHCGGKADQRKTSCNNPRWDK